MASAAVMESPAATAPATWNTGTAACSEVLRGCSMADAFEGMGSRFAASKPGGGRHRRTAPCNAAAGVGTISEGLATPGKSRGGIVAAEILSDRRRGERAPILLTQRGLPIGDASAVDRVMCPGSGGSIVIIEVVDG